MYSSSIKKHPDHGIYLLSYTEVKQKKEKGNCSNYILVCYFYTAKIIALNFDSGLYFSYKKKKNLINQNPVWVKQEQFSSHPSL